MCETKTCSKCGEVKGLGEFNRRSAATGKLHSWCKSCCRQYKADNREAMSARRRELARKDRIENPGKRQAYAREYYLSRQAELRSRAKEYHLQNRAERLAQCREYRLRERELIAQRRAAKYAENRAEINAKRREPGSAHKKLMQKRVDILADAYVVQKLGLVKAQATPELIALKREQLAIKRMARELKKAATKPTGENE